MYEIALSILKKLNKNGFEAYIIGGYPRNKYLGIDSTDIDICTNAKPNEIEKLFENTNLINSFYGNVLVTINNYEFEITTFRKEYDYINNRRPSKIEFIDSLEEDLKRRDFTINTLCIDSNENYIDILNCKEDLDNKIIKLIGNEEKIKEDALRILRAIRIATVLDFKIDDILSNYIINYRHLVDNLSEYRINKELDIILRNKRGIELMKKYKLDKFIKEG